ncbi:MAG: glycoside hydrolase family 20 zincin-like fold domain-containing protein [Gemmatimonadaceae bacterium]
MRHLPLALAAAALATAPLAAPAAQQPTRATAVAAAAAADSFALVPLPREIAARPSLHLAGGVSVAAPGGDADDRFAASDLAATLRERGVRAGSAASPRAVRVTLLRRSTPAARELLERHGLRFEPAMEPEGYVLVTEPGRVTVVGASAVGVFYGAQTVKQLVEGTGAAARLRGATIRDWPAMKYRGFHDDLSRGPVPTLEFQKKQIRTFAAYKLNVYSPYFEHTLAYASNPLAAPPAGGAVTREQVKELVAYAKRYHVDLVPEQEAFGHLHHVLKFEKYSALGETQHGHVLAPGQAGSLPLIRQWFAELDTLFPSKFVHIGADETFELGRGQTAERVKSEGIGAVYLGFLSQIEEALRPMGKRLLFWGDVAMNHPDLVRTLPKDLVAVAWQYNPQPRGFDRFLTPFTQAGMETWVAPGVNNWNRVYPNYALALPNIQGFVRDGQRLGATGMLNTAWDDDGEALFAQTWYAVLFGAAAAWQPGESSIERFQASYGRVFHGDTTGFVDEAQRKLIAAHAALQRSGAGDASDRLFWMDPYSEEGKFEGARIRPVAREVRLLAEEAIELVARARASYGASPALRERESLDALELGARRIDILAMKFQFAEEAAQLYARAYGAQSDSARRSATVRDLADVSGINGRFQDLRDAYALTRDLFERAWLAENRPYWMGNVLARYDMSTQTWIARADRVTDARLRWNRTRQLPAAGELGLALPAPAAADSAARAVAAPAGR